MVEMRGFEPLTSTLPVWHSPAELHPHNEINYSMGLCEMQPVFNKSENTLTIFLIMEDGFLRLRAWITKEFESDIIPQIGFNIYESAHREDGSYKVVDVSIDYRNSMCFVALEELEFLTEDEYLDCMKIAGLHEWNTDNQLKKL